MVRKEKDEGKSSSRFGGQRLPGGYEGRPEGEKLSASSQSELREIKSSRAWRFIQLLWRLRLALLPPGSLREKVWEKMALLLGPGPEKRGGEKDVPPGKSRGEKGGWAKSGTGRHPEPGHKQQALDWWEDFQNLRERMKDEDRRRKAAMDLDRPSQISFEGEDLGQRAQEIQFSKAEFPRVSIIIPVWNHLRLTLECLASVHRHTPEIPYELIVIDDHSQDQTPEVVPGIRNLIYLRNEKQMGFLRSCNRASQEARGEYLLFLNNDVQVTGGWLEALLRPFQEGEGVGVVGPKILFPDGRLQEAGAVVNPDGTTKMVGLGDDPGLPRYNYTRDVDYVSGVCLLLAREEFEAVGGFSDTFAPAYGEDVDLCLKVRERGKRILYHPRSRILHHLSASTDILGEGVKQHLSASNAQKMMETWGERIERQGMTRLISFYLPQFHPVPENDLWWGKGFTDWTNVAGARPNFKGHHQPHLPADLGFYDLRVREVLDQQAALADRYGIHGFCFYTYWFGGKRMLDVPVRRILDREESPIPFCLCWANENWTRSWDGREDQILISQGHAGKDDRAFIEDITPYLRHPDYIRVNGKPLLLVYRVGLLPEVQRTVEFWRRHCVDRGIGEIYLAMVDTLDQPLGVDRPAPSEYGFDAAVEFPPHPFDAKVVNLPGARINPSFAGTVHDYHQTALEYMKVPAPGFRRFRGVMPGWDNTPRRQDQGTTYVHSSPGAYQAWLEAALDFTREQFVGEERLVFINAWNEWAEGAYLEPDQRYGHGYLEATRNALERDLLRNR